MKYPTKRIFGKTWMGWLNFIVLQWFFIRLQGCVESKECLVLNAWDIRFTLPLTGWWSDYLPRGIYFTIYTFKK